MTRISFPLFPVSLHAAVHLPLRLLHGVWAAQKTGEKQTSTQSILQVFIVQMFWFLNYVSWPLRAQKHARFRRVVDEAKMGICTEQMKI